MNFLVMVYEREADYADAKLQQDMVAKHIAFRTGLGSKRIHSAGLMPTASARTVKIANGKKTVHDGAFAETKEQLGGYYLVDAPDIDAAVKIAEQVPMRENGSVEVRPLIAMSQ
jgi:hypothetical protein